MKKIVINLAERFRFPGPRFIALGPQSGEEFKNYLIGELHKIYPFGFNHFDKNNSIKVIVNLDGTQGYGSSFLEEGFGGLIRAGIPYDLVKNIDIISDEEPELICDIKDYILKAYQLKKSGVR